LPEQIYICTQMMTDEDMLSARNRRERLWTLYIQTLEKFTYGLEEQGVNIDDLELDIKITISSR
jgi:hypothetical protein